MPGNAEGYPGWVSMSWREIMADRKYPTASDPDNVSETICDGAFNVAIFGQLATLTFTHVRPDPEILLRDGSLELKSVVRARIVITMSNLIALKDLLIKAIQEPDTPVPPAGGIVTRH
jgi:hypothetical protein